MRLLVLAFSAVVCFAQQHEAGDDRRGYTDTPQIPGQPWKVHDAARPRPPKVTPGLPLLDERPPADAIVLFDGKDLSKWYTMRQGQPQEPQWTDVYKRQVVHHAAGSAAGTAVDRCV